MGSTESHPSSEIGPLPDQIQSSHFTDSSYEIWSTHPGISETIGYEDYLLYGLQRNGGIGVQKPMGYMPLGELVACGPVAERFVSDLKDRGMETRTFTEEEAHIVGGAYFSYDREALQALLDANQDTLTESDWPTDVDGYVATVASTTAPMHTPLFDLVADSFGDTRNPLRLSNAGTAKRRHPGEDVDPLR